MAIKIKTCPHHTLVCFGLSVLLVVHFVIRYVMAHSPVFAETYYDEAVTGNMALHILRGEFQLFFWGQPYMGALEAYLASFLFLLFGSTAFSLHLTGILVIAFLIVCINKIGTLVGGWVVGLLSAAFMAFSPLYLSVIALLATGGHEEACAFGGFILFGTCHLAFQPSRNKVALAGLIGILAGLAWWSSLLSVPFLLACGLGLAMARPRTFLTRIPGVGFAGFLLGSLPFWLWEIRHNFSTFGFFGHTGIGIFDQLPTRIYGVLRYSFFQSFLGDWWDGQSVLPSVPSVLAWSIWAVYYLPPFVLSLIVIFRWGQRIISLRNPFQEPIDLVAAVFWILVLVFSTSQQGATGSLRYSLTFYAPFSILIAVWLHKILAYHRGLGAGAMIVLFGFNLFLHFLFLQEYQDHPYRPVDGLIKALKGRGIQYAYADNRISQPLTFESQEKIICADYSGQRNYDYLRAVDQAPAGKVAIITHRELGNPPPEVMAASLQLIGGSFDRFEQGNYVVWYNFREPAFPLRAISSKDWRITTSQNTENAAMMKDRDILTGWEIPEKPGEWVQVDLGRVRNLGRVSLLPWPGMSREAGSLRLEISRDGQVWNTVNRDQYFLTGMTWVGGRPRLDENPRIQISFPPREGRYLRLTNRLQPEDPNKTWTIAELFIYETLEQPDPPRPEVEAALARAGQALERWEDDPTGPHPFFPGTNSSFRKRQVNWPEVIKWAQTAISLAPENEEAHQLLGRALYLGELEKSGENPDGKNLKLVTLFPPREGFRLSPSRFNVFSNTNNKEAGLAVDGNPSTRWGSLRGQEPGMVFQVGLGGTYSVNGLSLFLNNSLYDSPRNLKIMVSQDAAEWREIRATTFAEYAWCQGRVIKRNNYRFPPQAIRHLKLVQTGTDSVYWWSIYELEVLGAKTGD